MGRNLLYDGYIPGDHVTARCQICKYEKINCLLSLVFIISTFVGRHDDPTEERIFLFLLVLLLSISLLINKTS